MELKKFIKEALLNITEGVEEANTESNRFKIVGVRLNGTEIDGAYADFDVSVVLNKESGAKVEGEAKVELLTVVSANVDAHIDQSTSHQNTHNLKFRVYISEKKLNDQKITS